VVTLDRGDALPAWQAIGAGLLFGLAALVKAEPLVLLPVFGLFAACALPRGAWVAPLALWLLGLALVLAPWAARNHAHFDRLIVTSASGGTNFWIGNHRGGNGGNELGHEQAFRDGNRRATTAETNLAQNDAGWAEGLAFWREHTAEALATLPNKVWLTYSSDGGAVRNLAKTLERPTRLRLRAIANAYWWGVLALAAYGVSLAGRWPPRARVLVCGVPLAWFVIHLVFIGGPRFHAPETLSLAVLAAAGAIALGERFSPGEGAQV